MCAPHATDHVSVTLTRQEWDEVRALLDAKPAQLGTTAGVERLYEQWCRAGLLVDAQ